MEFAVIQDKVTRESSKTSAPRCTSQGVPTSITCDLLPFSPSEAMKITLPGCKLRIAVTIGWKEPPTAMRRILDMVNCF